MSSVPPSQPGMPIQQPVGPQQPQPRKKKRRWIFRLFWLLVFCAVVVALLPYLASTFPPVRNFLLSRAMPNLNGTITADDASLGWNKPIGFEGVEIRSPIGMPVVRIDELKGDRPLWKILLKPSVLGTYQVVRPHLTMVIYPNGSSSLSEVFTGTDPMAIKQTESKEVPDLSLAVELVDGSVTVSDSLGQNSWEAGPINFGFRLRPSTATSDGLARLEIPRGKVFDHVRVTPQVCEDMLKYIAPVMAEATRAEGTFSIDLDKWSLPLKAPSEGHGKGVLTVHELSIGAGPIIQQILAAVGVGGRLVAVDEAPIKFELADGRLSHEGLAFHVDKVKFTTSGSVGVEDESLDLAINVYLPEEIQAQRPVLQAMAGQAIMIPVRGTLKEPKVDVQGLSQSGIKALTETIDRLITPPDTTTEGTKTDTATDDKADSEAAPAVDVGSILNTVEELRRRRQEQRQEQLKENPDATRPLLNRPLLNPDRDRPLLKRILTPSDQK